MPSRRCRGGASETSPRSRSCPPAPRLRSLIWRRRRPQTTSSRLPSLPSILFRPRSLEGACVRAPGSAYRCAVGRARRGSGGRLDGAEDCGTVSVSVRSTSFVRPRPFARPSVPPPQHLAGSSRWSFVVVGHPRRTKGAFLESKLAACLSVYLVEGRVGPPWRRKVRPPARKGEMRLSPHPSNHCCLPRSVGASPPLPSVDLTLTDTWRACGDWNPISACLAPHSPVATFAVRRHRGVGSAN